ncbi:Bro-N domain-containing protein [Pseudorhodoferax sp. LjRoot39]|uniref:BRO-N domain-containing protein n=1 Tax=Pseudorhodoferax sp. LjRoot39 TaxID=3342328 RepID=UPI003ECC7B06
MSNIVPFNFDGASVRVIDINGEPHFVGKDVAEALGYADTTNAMKQHCKGVAKRHPLQTTGGIQEMRVLAEPDVLRLIVASNLPAAERFERWVFEEVLPSIRKTGSYTAKTTRPQTLSRNQVAASILLLRSAAEDLKLSPSAVLGGYQRLELQLGVTGLLPGYAVDASNSASGSSEETKSAAELLEIHSVGLSAIAFNRLLLQHGFIEERERPSSKGGTKKFKVCTNMEFGKNLTNPNNPRETQPHWYVRKFPELLDLVIPAKPKVATA